MVKQTRKKKSDSTEINYKSGANMIPGYIPTTEQLERLRQESLGRVESLRDYQNNPSRTSGWRHWIDREDHNEYFY